MLISDMNKAQLLELKAQLSVDASAVEAALAKFKLSKEAAVKLIANKKDEAMALIKEAEEIAKEAEISFSFDLAYGMGGHFGPDYDEPHNYRWISSSENC